MIETSEITIEGIAGALGEDVRSNSDVASRETVSATGFAERRIARSGLFELSMKAVTALEGAEDVGAVVAATFSNEMRFPPLSVRIASALKLPSDTVAFDLQLACSAYPYAVYLAGKLAADLKRKVLVVDGDVQSRFAKSPDVLAVMSDAATATIVSAPERTGGKSVFSFYSGYSEALVCREEIEMDGFKVYAFVAGEVRRLVGRFAELHGGDIDAFVPHQANMYMVRQLARATGLEDRLVTSGGKFGNTGSSSVALALARCHGGCRALIAGFGAGLSAAVGTVRLADNFEGVVI
jgi:3-oxoacyl-[acyl-carrier-protein] synthase-3